MKHVKFRTYEGIEQADIELDPGINVFVGETDTGKSSIVRGLLRFLYNAIGDFFVMAGAKKAVVEVDGVVWEKGKTVNRYKVGDKTYDKVGRGVVPEEVIKKTGVRVVEFGEGVSRRLNVSEQFGGEFIVGDKPSDNAKIIGSLSGIGIVFNALREATADLTRSTRNVDGLTERLEETKAKVKGFKYLKKVVAALRGVDKQIEAHKETVLLEATLLGLRDAHAKYQQEQRDLTQEIKRNQRVADIDFERLDNLVCDLESVKQFSAKLTKFRAAVEEAGETLKKNRGVALISTDVLTESIIECDRFLLLQKRFAAAEKVVVKAKTDVEEAKEDLDETIKMYKKAMDDVEVCPLTEQALPEYCKKALKGMGDV